MEQRELRKKVEDVISRFPWYQKYMKDLDVVQLNQLPYLTSDILEKYYYHQSFDESYSIYQTSGSSTGRRKRIAYSREDDQRYLESKCKVYADFIQGSDIKSAMSDMGTGHAANTALGVFKSLGLLGAEIPYTLPISEHIEKLNHFKPDLFYTMPSIMDSLLLAAEDPTKFGIKKVILVGEVASREWQKKVAHQLGIKEEDIMDTYGSIEIGTIAYYSHNYQRYLFIDGIIAEGIQSEEIGYGSDLLGPEERILALTSLSREMFPAIRYITYDVVRDFRTIKVHGEYKQSFECLAKRVGTEWKHGEKISLYDLEEVIFRYLDRASIRVQINNNALIVWIQTNELTDSLRKKIQQEIQVRIPEIGIMIQQGILKEIRVETALDEIQFQDQSVKKKKIYNKDLIEDAGS